MSITKCDVRGVVEVRIMSGILSLHMEKRWFFIYVNLNGLRAKRYEYGNVFVHKDLKGSLTRDFWEKLIHEKKLETQNLMSDSL